MLAKETAALSGLWSGKDEVFLQQHRGFCAGQIMLLSCCAVLGCESFLVRLGHQQIFCGNYLKSPDLWALDLDHDMFITKACRSPQM